MFEVNQKVRCKFYGEGFVRCVDRDADYPVIVRFVSGEWNAYTKDGKWHEDYDEPCITVVEE